MTTLADIALSCAKRLGRVNAVGTAIIDLEDEIKEGVAETIRFHNRRPWHLTEFHQATFKTAVGTTWYHTVGLTSGFGDQDDTRTGVDVNAIVDIQYARLNPDLKERLDPIRMEDFERLHEGSSPSGTPIYYTLYGGAIGLWPTPSVGDVEVFLNVVIKPVIPAGDEDENIWFTEEPEMIRAGACKHVLINYIRDLERAQHFAAIEQGRADELHREYVRKASSGKIKPHD